MFVAAEKNHEDRLTLGVVQDEAVGVWPVTTREDA